jgi:hypothetical protein
MQNQSPCDILRIVINDYYYQGANRMSESTRGLILLVLILLLLLVVAFYGSNYVLKRAIRQVVQKFREVDALTPATAKTYEELGFVRKGLFQFKILRDYRPAALGLLMNRGVILITEDNRVYLSEEDLSRSDFAQTQKN